MEHRYVDVRRRALWLTAAVLAWMWALALVVTSAADYLYRPVSDRLSDLSIYVHAITALQDGRSLYWYQSPSGGPFTYPPAAAVALWPTSFVPQRALEVAWTVATYLAVFAIAWIAWRSVCEFARYDPRLAWLRRQWVFPTMAALLLASKPLQSNLRFGQVSVFLVLLVLIDLIILRDSRRQGVLTGLAGAVKLTPLLFVAFYWIAGRRRTSVVAVLSFLVITFTAWAILATDSYAYWTHEMWHTTDLGALPHTGNQSLYALLLRAQANSVVTTLAWIAGSLLAVGLGLWRGRLALLRGQPLLAASIVGTASVIASPISWTHHQLWLVLAAFGVVSHKPTRDWVNRVLLLVVMLHGVPGLVELGSAGAWIDDNERFLIAVYIACLMPIADVRARRVATAVTADTPTANEEDEVPQNRSSSVAAPVIERSSRSPKRLTYKQPRLVQLTNCPCVGGSSERPCAI